MTNPARPTLTDLLNTWQEWSYRNLLHSSLDRATADGNAESQAVLLRALDRAPTVQPLDALVANHELSSLLRGWQWHAVRAAREAGATWPQIAAALHTTPEQARADYLRKIEDAEQHVPDLTDTTPYRAVLDDAPAATARGSVDEVRRRPPAAAQLNAQARRSGR